MRRWISLCLVMLLLAACAPNVQTPPADVESTPPVTTEPVTTPPETEPAPMTTTDSLTITPVTTAVPETTAPINWDKTLEKFFAEQFEEDRAEPKAVEIPRDVLWDGSFYTPGNCTGFTVEEGNTAFCAVDGVLYSADMSRLVAYPSASAATSFTVPDSVKYISQGAFAGSRHLTRVELPDGLERIGTFAFGYCQALTDIRLPNSLTEIEPMAFKDCDALTMVAVPGSVTHLGAAAFYCCDSLTTAIIGEGVTTIEHNAFSDCPSLTTLMIPGTVERIHGYYYGHEPFKDSPWFAAQTDEFVIVGDGVLIAYNGTATDVVLPAEVKSIAGGIIWPDTVKFITMPKAMYDQLPTMPHCINKAEITIIPVGLSAKNEDAMPTPDEVMEAYRKATEAASWFRIASLLEQGDPSEPLDMSDQVVERDITYFRVRQFDSYSAFCEYLSTLFSDALVQSFLSGNGPMYIEHNGDLYGKFGMRGTNVFMGQESYKIEQVNSEQINLLVEVEVMEEDLMTVKEYQTFEFLYIQMNGKWVFATFPEIR